MLVESSMQLEDTRPLEGKLELVGEKDGASAAFPLRRYCTESTESISSVDVASQFGNEGTTDLPSSTEKTIAESDDDFTALLQEAAEEASQERLFRAGRLLRRAPRSQVLPDKHTQWLEMANECERVVDELMEPPRPTKQGWRKQGELHHDFGSHKLHTLVYYKLHERSAAISCRIDSTLEPSLLVPLLSVFNESDLYASWMPSWKHPKVGVRHSRKLQEMGRGNQIIHVAADLPFPITNRECIMHCYAVDDIEDRAAIVIKMKSLDPDQLPDLHVPPTESGTVRVDLDAGMLIRACPKDHPVLGAATGLPNESSGDLLLFSMYQCVDANVRLVPRQLINFFTRTVLMSMWTTLIGVAAEVRDGKRPEHEQAIRSKPELYKWVAERVTVMLEKVRECPGYA